MLCCLLEIHANLAKLHAKFFDSVDSPPGFIELWNGAIHELYAEIEFVVLAETMPEGWPLVRKLQKMGNTAFTLDPEMQSEKDHVGPEKSARREGAEEH